MPESKLDPEKLYSTLRDYLKHEDSLINWRISWNLGLQTALFAALGWVLKKPAANEQSLPDDIVCYAPFAIAIVGQVIGLSSFLGIVAAQRSLDVLSDRWKKTRTALGERLWTDYYPALSAGDDPFARRFGKWAAFGPICILQLSWIVLIPELTPKWWGLFTVVPNIWILYELWCSGRPGLKRELPRLGEDASKSAGKPST